LEDRLDFGGDLDVGWKEEIGKVDGIFAGALEVGGEIALVDPESDGFEAGGEDDG
jgi:hypothetical protein